MQFFNKFKSKLFGAVPIQGGAGCGMTHSTSSSKIGKKRIYKYGKD